VPDAGSHPHASLNHNPSILVGATYSPSSSLLPRTAFQGSVTPQDSVTMREIGSPQSEVPNTIFFEKYLSSSTHTSLASFRLILA
jgi:hypothetical protein